MTNEPLGLGDRMKAYEDCFRFILPKRSPKIIRLDGKAFHTYLRRVEKPYDRTVMDAMISAAQAVVQSIGGSARCAYIQSDECSILLNDTLTLNTEAWFANNIQKIVSVASSIFTGEFNNTIAATLAQKAPTEFVGPAAFDARIFLLPDIVEVNNYFVWRQKDAIRNSIQQFGTKEFSAKELHGLNNELVLDMLRNAGKPWNEEEVWKQRGIVIANKFKDEAIPLFWEDTDYIKNLYTPPNSVTEVVVNGP